MGEAEATESGGPLVLGVYLGGMFLFKVQYRFSERTDLKRAPRVLTGGYSQVSAVEMEHFHHSRRFPQPLFMTPRQG